MQNFYHSGRRVVTVAADFLGISFAFGAALQKFRF